MIQNLQRNQLKLSDAEGKRLLKQTQIFRGTLELSFTDAVSGATTEAGQKAKLKR